MVEKVIRFAVGTADGPRSGVWRLWTNGRKGDVYLASRHLGGTSKVSFHESGRWRNALITTPALGSSDSVVVNLQGGDDPRMAHVWDRTDNAGPGWTMGFAIIVPEPDVYGPTPATRLKNEVVYRRPPAVGSSAVMVLLWGAPAAPLRQHPPLVADGSWPIGHLDVANGDRVWVVTFDLPFADEAEQFAEAKRAALEHIAAASAEPLTLENRRASVHGVRADDGLRFVLDLALDVPGTEYLR
jgi:hypothetical protein